MCVIPAGEILVFEGGRVVDQLQHANEVLVNQPGYQSNSFEQTEEKNPPLLITRYEYEYTGLYAWNRLKSFEISFYRKT